MCKWARKIERKEGLSERNERRKKKEERVRDTGGKVERERDIKRKRLYEKRERERDRGERKKLVVQCKSPERFSAFGLK